MASKQMLVTVVAVAALAVAFLPGLAVATEHMVGDDKGWTLNFNYTAWAETQQFVVGDTLVFKYNIGAHNVVEVGGPDFLTCTQSANAIGWSLNCNYTAWAETQQFAVGDTLVFKYNIGAHNVVEVAGPDFLTCTQSANAIIWNSGEDQVTLDKAGRRWFFCGVDQHCQNGMKLKITVFETAAPTPQPALSA
ncbi:hypothetical protein ZWY2020_018047 [Hordeum vulgare]|nr:hypothetical protein ZWY2020_018047 [Hordeum vulgare]